MASSETTSMSGVPSLVDLCLGVVKDDLLRGVDANLLSGVYQLPPDLFDRLLPLLPPLALQILQERLPLDFWDDDIASPDSYDFPRKKRRCMIFGRAWETLYKARWPDCGHKNRKLQLCSFHNLMKIRETKHEFSHNWQQMYWEIHLQNSLDAATEIASFPSFEGHVGEQHTEDVNLTAESFQTKIMSKSREPLVQPQGSVLSQNVSEWPESWPARLEKSPYWLLSSEKGVCMGSQLLKILLQLLRFIYIGHKL